MEVVLVSRKNEGKIVKKAAAALKKGKVLVIPTDTVYGLLADATNKKAVQRVFRVKGRKEGKPLPIFVKDIAMAKKLAKISKKQEQFLKKSWPGKVTLVLESKGKLPKETGTTKFIGLRIPKHKLVQHILQKAKKPLTGTSANLSGKTPLRDSKKVKQQFQGRKHAPDMLLDAGKMPFAKPSKVVDIIAAKHRVLRG